ncbi:Gph2 [Desulforapulum autotrophicum HRM2]|uniref:phosphoglycolate phosphatase n=1 Tax=Desulforapulum autotrophicum (strain ATCC 43914 / DSM 3382 / VKM B-1955 / HRM2) TaxID=177437 RepID=C0QEX9_DESAH|nr:HAD family hydrolase [Desulforapulum autotrophicum]ACN17480.1 Gph2 [Desulforapulum autotrophicum HRM2]
MKYKAVIFDLDGTLLDTIEDLADSMNRVLHDRGFPTHPTEAFRYFVGSGIAMLVSRALPLDKRNDTLAADCLEAFKREYNCNWNKKTKPYKGVSELLDALTAKHTKMAVLTNKPQHFAELCVREFLSNWKFAVILGQRDGFPIKPDPTGPREIARRLDIPSQEFLYLGDSDVDMITAIGANMLPVGAMWGFRSKKELLEAGAVKVIGWPTELLEFVD